MDTPLWLGQIANAGAMLGALAWGRQPRRGALRDGAGAGAFKHEDWQALLRRFVQNGNVDYENFKRVRRIVEAYLERIADARPDTWVDADDQLAFYINAYNAIVVHQIILHYPVRSFLAIPAGFARPYPVGQQNVSLMELEHSKIRAYGDPRVHMALVCGARSCPWLQSFAYNGPELQDQLNTVTSQFLADPERGLHYDQATHTLHVSSILHWFAADWADPASMPSLARSAWGQIRPSMALPALRRWMPQNVQQALQQTTKPPHLVFKPYDWQLNGPPIAS